MWSPSQLAILKALAFKRGLALDPTRFGHVSKIGHIVHIVSSPVHCSTGPKLCPCKSAPLSLSLSLSLSLMVSFVLGLHHCIYRGTWSVDISRCSFLQFLHTGKPLKPMKCHGVVGACGTVQFFIHYIVSRCMVFGET